MSKPRIVACIFARGGSKGVPRKNVREFNGKPLIAWTIELAKSTGLFDQIVVSTDDEEIAAVAREYGAEVPFMRPAELASDTAPERLSWRHAVQNLPPLDILVSLPATSPLRQPETIKKCLDLYMSEDVDTVIAITKSNVHPSFNMVEIDNSGYIHLLEHTDRAVLRRQDSRDVYLMTTLCYVTSPRVIMDYSRVMDGKVKAVLVEQEESIDIDTLVDFKVAEFLHLNMSNNVSMGE